MNVSLLMQVASSDHELASVTFGLNMQLPPLNCELLNSVFFFYVLSVGIRYLFYPLDSDRCYRYHVGLPVAAIGLHGSVEYTVRGYSSL